MNLSARTSPSATAKSKPVIAPETIRPLLRAEYEHMIELGWFHDERVELLQGLLVTMSPQKPRHAHVCWLLAQRLAKALEGQAMVRSQAPFALSQNSEPEPDIAVVPPADYAQGHPERAFLLIEVADSSVAKDQGVKAVLYAQGGVPEYWVVNLVDQIIVVYRDSADGAYQTVTSHARGEVLAPAAFPDVLVPVSDIL